MSTFRETIEWVGKGADVAGVLILVIGAVVATVRYLRAIGAGDAYAQFRRDLGRAILLGLEFLVAADIIRTVAIDPTLPKLAALGLLVLIRTFLSFALELEIEGRWPWQEKERGPGSVDRAANER